MGPLAQIAQAVGLGAVHALVALHQSGGDQALLQILPGRFRRFDRGALGFALLGAEDDVAFEVSDAQRTGFFESALEFVGFRFFGLHLLS